MPLLESISPSASEAITLGMATHGEVAPSVTGSLDENVRAICVAARAASRRIGPKGRDVKDAALLAIARALEAGLRAVLTANEADLEAARSAGTKGAMLDRL